MSGCVRVRVFVLFVCLCVRACVCEYACGFGASPDLSSPLFLLHLFESHVVVNPESLQAAQE